MAHLALLVARPALAVNTAGATNTAAASMTPERLILLLGAALVALPLPAHARQSPAWPVNLHGYRVADGMPESACISVTLAPHNKVLARHLKLPAISQLNGYTTTVIPAPETGNGRVYESPGGQLWTVTADGLQEFHNGEWVLHPIPEISAEFRARVTRLIDPVPLCPVRQGVVLLLLPDRLLEFSAEDPDHPRIGLRLAAAQTQLERFSGMAQSRDGSLWIAGERGLAKASEPVRNLKPDTAWHDYLPPPSLQIHNLQQPHLDDQGRVNLLAESITLRQKAIAHFDGENWTIEPIPLEKVRFAWRGPDQTDWAATIDSLYEWEASSREVLSSEEASARQYYDLAVEPGGAFWLATSDGLFRYAPLTWRSPPPVQKINSLVHYLATDEAGRLWFVAGNGLHVVQNDHHRESPLPTFAPNTPLPVRGLFPLKDGSLFLQGDTQCFQFNPQAGTFAAVSSPGAARRLEALGVLRDGKLCLQTSSVGAAEPVSRLETYDGARFEPLSVPPPERPPGNRLSILFAAQNGDLWVSGDRGTAWYHDQKWRTFLSSDGTSPDSAVSFAEFADGKIWCATPDRVWAFDGKSWAAVRAGLDHANALIATRDGSLWVGTDSGLHRFLQGAWLENSTEDGLPAGGVRSLCEDLRGRVWAGTAHGLSLYHPEADPDPPHTSIDLLGSKEKNIPEGGTIYLALSGQDKWKYTPRQRLLYSYQLNGREWSPFQEERTVSFTDLPAGKNYLQARAMDRNGNVDPNPASFEFVVVLPWYKESRLVLISLAGLAVALFFAGLAFNRHRQLLRSYAEVERKVAERTHELELASRQLVHSQKMNALGALAAGIAHDFNNILSIIKGSAQIIEDNLDNPEKIRTRAERISTVVEQGAGIVKAMLGFSRDSADQPGACEVNAVLNDTVRLLGDRFLREVQVTLECAPALPEILCSKDFIQQILLNFIFNAAESMSGRKQIVLTTRLLDTPPPEPVLAPAPAASYVAVSVRDSGCGIAPDVLPRIFEPFFTTKAFSARRGTGLGLSMAYELAKKMEAGIAVETGVSQGSTFTLILPVRPAGSQTAASASQAAPVSAETKPTDELR